MSPFDGVEAIARAVLYEGYVLWPYRRSALKNQRRWTFGGVYPRAWSEAGHPDDAWRMVTDCLIRGSADARVEVRVRFLQVVRRGLERPVDGGGGGREAVDELVSPAGGGERHLAWEEATEREIDLGAHRLGDLTSGDPVEIEVAIPAGRREEPVDGDSPTGWTVRTWNALAGRIELSARPGEDAPGVHRVRIAIENLTPLAGGGAPEAAGELDRQEAVERAFISTHTVLATDQAPGFVSLADPPAELADAAEACRTGCVGTWPVLAGEPGDGSILLSSPIILEDHPQIAPESPGDLFDGSEIDQMLVLNVLALTDEEREEMAASDPKAREILERCAALGPEEMRRLHGVLRDPRTIGPDRRPGPPAPRDEARDLPPSWGELNAPVEQAMDLDGITLRPGSRVRLHPRAGGDIFDLALAGQVAVVEGVDQDHAGNVHLAVVLERDPGRDLGESRYPGHRFFFTPGEVEPLPDAPDQALGAFGRPRRTLVAGIGNIFLGDDGFGVEVVRRLTERWSGPAGRSGPPGVDAIDFGIRGMDLVYALAKGYDAAILVDAAPRGEAPGTVSVVEPELPEGVDEMGVSPELHAMDPVKALAMARAHGPLPAVVRLVVCEPEEVLEAEDWHDARMELSAVVEAAVGPAVDTVEALIADLADLRRPPDTAASPSPERNPNSGETAEAVEKEMS